jgi:phage-related protein
MVVVKLPALTSLPYSHAAPSEWTANVHDALDLIQRKFDAVSQNVNLMIARLNECAIIGNTVRNAVLDDTSTGNACHSHMARQLEVVEAVEYIS